MSAVPLDPASIAATLEAELDRRWPALRAEQPPERYAAALRAPAGPGSYRRIDAALSAWCDDLRSRPGGGEALEHYHRIVLARLIGLSTGAGEVATLPASVRERVHLEHQRILQELQVPKRSYYLHENDNFAKDLALASLRLLPCGAEHVDLHSGIPRSLALAGGLPQAFTVLGAAAANGGFRPWFESHWDRRLLAEFDAAGYDRFYQRVAELLEAHPAARGLIGSSWWFDPAVAGISPELAFLTATPMANGARRFRVGANEAATRDALRFARERSRLHAAGRYQPCVFMIAWGRRSLLAWARRGG